MFKRHQPEEIYLSDIWICKLTRYGFSFSAIIDALPSALVSKIAYLIIMSTVLAHEIIFILRRCLLQSCLRSARSAQAFNILGFHTTVLPVLPEILQQERMLLTLTQRRLLFAMTSMAMALLNMMFWVMS